MKRKICRALTLAALIAAFVLALGCGAALADIGGSCGAHVTWSLNTTTGVLTVSGTGAVNDYSYSSNLSPLKGDSRVKSLVVEQGVTTIGNYFLYQCTNLTSVSLPDGLQSIGNGAFSRCALNSLSLPDSLSFIGRDAFNGNNGITSLQTPMGLKDIGGAAFRGMSGLTSVTFSPFLKTIGEESFKNCTSLQTVELWDGLTTVGDWAFQDCSSLTNVYVIGPSITFGNNVFSRCNENLTLIGYDLAPAHAYATENGISYASMDGKCGDDLEYLFNYSSKSMVIRGTGPMYDSSQPWAAFRSQIESVTLEEGVTTIGKYAFYECRSLYGTHLPSTLTHIGTEAFAFCTGMISITLPKNLESIGSTAFGSCINLLSITIPEGVTTLKFQTFVNCFGLTSVTLPWSLTEISNSVFRSCTSLRNITIPGSVTTIGDDAFSGCTALTKIDLPNSVNHVGSNAFYDCSSLQAAAFYYSNTEIKPNAFQKTDSLTLYGWSNSTAHDYANANAIPFVNLSSLSCKCGDNLIWTLNTNTGAATITGTGPMWNYNHNSSNWSPTTMYKDIITSVTFDDRATTVGNWFFDGCKYLTSVHLPASLVRVGSNAFRGCTGLQDITIPEGVKSIGVSAFINCTGLTGIKLPLSVTEIGVYAFSGCVNLYTAEIPNPDCVIGNEAYNVFEGTSLLILKGHYCSTTEDYACNAPHAMEHLTPFPGFFLPENLTAIEGEAFQGIKAIAVVIPKNIQSISGNPFAGSSVQFIYGFPGTPAETLAQDYLSQFRFVPLTDTWYTRLKNEH